MQKTITTFTDDLTGKEGTDIETVTFTVNGESYEIDLNKFNKNNFFRSLKKYMDNGRRVRTGKVRSHRDVRHDREYVHTVRSWAQDQGMEVSNRGRVPLAVYEQYEKANA